MSLARRSPRPLPRGGRPGPAIPPSGRKRAQPATLIGPSWTAWPSRTRTVVLNWAGRCARPMASAERRFGRYSFVRLPIRLSAKGAVEDHLSERALEYGELLVVQLCHEQLGDRA